jgi:tetratricopeptide (TPR) repeat protein
MTDVLVQKVENQPFEDSNSSVPFVEVINAIGKHFNHTSTDSVATRFERDPNSGDTVIGIQSRATARDVLTLLKDETNTDISDFGRRLKDIGILLSREEAVQKSDKAKEFAKSVYAVGCSVRNEETSSKADLTTEGLSNESQEYKDELFLWAIGRDNPDSSYARNLYKGDKRIHPVERNVYGHVIAKEQREMKAKRNRETLSRRDRIIRSFVSGLERSGGELPEQTKQGLEKTYLSAARQAVINILTKNAWTNWEKNLRIPPKERHIYLDDQILKVFEKIPGFSDESLRIVDAVEELSKSERWKGLSQIEKVRDIWDVCQTYTHKETYKPTKAIETRELECQLKTFLAGNLLNKYVPDVKTAAWYENGHVKLALQVEGTNYMFDSNLQKEDGKTRNDSVINISQLDTKTVVDITKDINETLNRFFDSKIEISNPLVKYGYISVGDFDKLTVSGILINIAKYFDKDLSLAITRLAIEVNPNSADAYNNLGTKLTGAEAIKAFKKSIEINPNSDEAYNNLAGELPDIEAIEMLKKAVAINAFSLNARFNIARIIFSNPSLQSIENLELARNNINFYIEIAKDRPLLNTTPEFTNYAPRFKEYFTKKIIELNQQKGPNINSGEKK